MKPWKAGLAAFAILLVALGCLLLLVWAFSFVPDRDDKKDCVEREGIFVQGGRNGDDVCFKKDAVLKNYG